MPNFQWQPTVDTRLAGSIGDIMARSGDVRAESIRAAGAAKAHAIGTIGQAAAGTLEDIMQGRRVEKQKQAAKVEQEAVRQVFVDALNQDGSYDLGKIQKSLPPAYAHHLEGMLEFADKANTTRLTQKKLTAELTPKPVEPPKLADHDPTRDLINPLTGEVVRPGVPAPVKPPSPEKAPDAGTFPDYLGRLAQSQGKTISALSPKEILAAKQAFDAAGRAPVGAGAQGTPAWAIAPSEAPVPGGGLNESALAKLPPEIASQVKAMVEGRRSLDPRVVSTPAGKALLDAAYAYDPSFDQINYNSRSKTRTDFTSGASSKQVNALNTVIGHLDGLSQAADALHNGNVQFFNSAKNLVGRKSGDAAVPKFETVKKAVSDELTRVWRQGGGAEADIKAWQSSLDASESPQQLHGVIAQIGDLLESKLTSLQETYRQGMGTDKISVITPAAAAVLERLRGGGAAVPTATPAQVKVGKYTVTVAP